MQLSFCLEWQNVYQLCLQCRCKLCTFNIIDLWKSAPRGPASSVVLKGNMRRPLLFYNSLDGLLGQQHQCNWIIRNHKQHLLLVLCLWTPAGQLSLDSIKRTRALVLLQDPPSSSGMSASWATVNVNENAQQSTRGAASVQKYPLMRLYISYKNEFSTCLP